MKQTTKQEVMQRMGLDYKPDLGNAQKLAELAAANLRKAIPAPTTDAKKMTTSTSQAGAGL